MARDKFSITPEKWHGDDVGNLPVDESEAEVWAVRQITPDGADFMDSFESREEAVRYIREIGGEEV